MELFRLIGTIAVNNQEANNAINETTEQASQSGSRMETIAGKIGNVVSKMAKIGVAAVGVAATGIAAVTKSAIENYADYEQLVGGVETLFKNSSGQVLKYANDAYKTAGMSANQYMETVTSFSASLLQGLHGDTAKAAKVSNTAITDMSDNANKMGTDMSLIENAYQGFAKQNYTMLDNLKLGYGGTGAEMARLINDSGVLGKTTKVTAKTVNDVSFDKIIEAIHVLQGRMGITGTTSKEAASTISGSIATMKAAWTNFTTGLADPDQDIGVLMKNLIDSVLTVVGNIAPRIVATLPRVAEGVSNLINMLGGKLPALIGELLPPLLKAAINLVKNLVTNLPNLLSSLVPALLSAISAVFNQVFSMLPDTLKNLGSYIIQSFSPALENLKSAFNSIKSAIQPVIDAFTSFITSGTTAEGAINLLKVAIDILSSALTAITTVISTFADGLDKAVGFLQEHENIATVLAIAIGTLTAAIVAYNVAQTINNAGGVAALAQKGLLTAATVAETAATTAATVATSAFGAVVAFLTSPITIVIAAIGALIAIGVLLYKNWDEINTACVTIWNGIKDFFSKIWDGIKSIFTNVLNSIKSTVSSVWNNIKSTISSVWNSIKSTISTVLNSIKSTVSSVWNAITSTISTVLNSIKSVISTIWNGIKSVISTVLNSIKSTISTIWNGIKTTISTVLNGVKTTVSSVWNGIKSVISTVIDGIKSTVSDKFNAVKTTISNVFNAVKTKVSDVWNGITEKIKGAIDKIKGFFNFKWSLPKIKLPHFKIKGKFSIDPPRTPSFGVDWYRKAMDNPMILTKPTAFGINSAGQIMAGGEAGKEVVAGASTLMKMISDSVSAQNDKTVYLLNQILNTMISIDNNAYFKLKKSLEGTTLKVNDREFARMVKEVI